MKYPVTNGSVLGVAAATKTVAFGKSRKVRAIQYAEASAI